MTDEHLGNLSRKLLCCLEFIPLKLKMIFGVHEERWSKLPYDVMQLILQRLLMPDYLICRDVCRSWRAAIDSKRCLPAYQQLPWLLLDSSNTYYFKEKDGCFVRDGKLYKSKNYWRICLGSIEGWLIMADRHLLTWHFFLLNPISGARIVLPSHTWFNTFFYRPKAVASSVPTITTLQRGCYVSCLHFDKIGSLAFCAPADKSWTFIEAKVEDERVLSFRDAEIVDGKLYAVGSNALEILMVFDIQLDTNGCGVHTYTAQRLVTLHPKITNYLVDDCVFYRHFYLAKDSESNELFMIFRDVVDGKTTAFQVLKFEYNVATCPQWVEIVDLRGRALFLGGFNNKIISSSTSFPDHQTLERNSIYFVFDWSRLEWESGVFCLTTRRIKPLIFPQNHLHSGSNETLWFTPNPL